MGKYRVIDEYLRKNTWRYKENSNFSYSWSGLQAHIANNTVANYILHIIDRDISYAHRNGDIHIHNLESGLVPYCHGGDLLMLIQKGVISADVKSLPAKHFSSICDHINNYIYMSQLEYGGAQAFSDVNTLLAPFVYFDGLSRDEVRQVIQRLVWNLNFTSRQAFQCYSDDTEVLTKRGWVYFKDLRYSDEVLTYNMETKELEWEYPIRIVKYTYTGPMFHLKCNRSDQLVTLHHRVVVYKYNSNEVVFRLVEDLFKLKSPIQVPITGEYNKEDYPIPDDVLRLYAWILSEGCVRVSIYQSSVNSRNVNRIRDLLERLNIKYSEDVRVRESSYSSNPVHAFTFTLTSDYRRGVPFNYMLLSRRQARLFLDEYRKGDGSEDRFRLYCKSKELVDMLSALCVIAGYGFNILRHKNMYVISVVSVKDRTYNVKREISNYSGDVWCATVSNGTLVTRRNGKIAISGNTPFSNFTFNLTCPKHYEDMPIIIGGEVKKNYTYGDFADESNLILEVFNDVLLERDAYGRPFTFPIPTLNLTNRIDWNSEVMDSVMVVTKELGAYYFMNYVGSGINEDTVRAMCCRLNLNLEELSPTRGLWNFTGGTGSLGVVTLNMSRVGYLSRDDDDIYEHLDVILDKAKRYLLFKEKKIRESLKRGLLPFSKYYMFNPDRYFRTIGVLGLNEMCLNFTGKSIVDNVDLVVNVLSYIREWTRKTQKDTGKLWNLELTPAEGSCYRLALIDRKKFRDIHTLGTKKSPYYSSLIVPPSYNISFRDRLSIEEKILPLFTGGTVFRTYVGNNNVPLQSVKRLVYMLSRTAIPYYDITLTYSVCTSCRKTFSGNLDKCPECNGSVLVYSRVVGYYRPSIKYNKGKYQEFKERRYVDISKV